MQKPEVRFGDSTLRLNGDGSAFLPEYNTLLIADVHLGKSGVFRKAGIPAPQGLHEKNIDQLVRAFAAHPSATVVFLGDVFHGLQNKETRSLQSVLDAHPAHTFILVKGSSLPWWINGKLGRYFVYTSRQVQILIRIRRSQWRPPSKGSPPSLMTFFWSAAIYTPALLCAEKDVRAPELRPFISIRGSAFYPRLGHLPGSMP
jgi:hypothetical protein